MIEITRAGQRKADALESPISSIAREFIQNGLLLALAEVDAARVLRERVRDEIYDYFLETMERALPVFRTAHRPVAFLSMLYDTYQKSIVWSGTDF